MGVRGCAVLDWRGGLGVTIRAELFERGVVVVGCGAVILVVKDRVVLVTGCTVVVLVSAVRAVVGAEVVDCLVVDSLVVVCDVVALLVGAGVVLSAVVVWLGGGVVVGVVSRAAVVLVVVLTVVVTGGRSGTADSLLGGTGRRFGICWDHTLPALQAPPREPHMTSSSQAPCHSSD